MALNGSRIGAAAFLVGLSLAGPQVVGVASADPTDTDSAAAGSTSRPGSAPVHRSDRPINRGAGGSAHPVVVGGVPTPTSAQRVRRIPASAAVARPAAVQLNPVMPVAPAVAPAGQPLTSPAAPDQSIATVAVRIAQVLDRADDWLSGLPVNPVNELLSGALLLVRRTLLPNVGPIPALTVGNVSVLEGDAGTSEAVFTVTLARAYDTPVTVGYATRPEVPGIGDADYVPVSGLLTFTPGQTSEQVAVTILGDTADEPTETFALTTYATLQSAVVTGVVLGQGVGTVIGDDIPGCVQQGDCSNLDLTYRRLSGELGFVNFTDSDLTGTDFSGATLTGANLTRADLSGANLAGAVLVYTNLTRADLTGANLTGVLADRATLTNANLERAVLVDANLGFATMNGVNLAGADLTNATLDGAKLAGANLTGANLSRTKLVIADLSRAQLTGATLTRTDLAGANLVQANLRGTDLTTAYLAGADLSFQNLSRMDLTGANLTGANLTGADLHAANLTDANLTGANLTGIAAGALWGTANLDAIDILWNRYLEEAQRRGLIRPGPGDGIIGGRGTATGRLEWRYWTVPDRLLDRLDWPVQGYLAVPEAVNMTGATLTEATLIGADLSGADLTNANLVGADLSCGDAERCRFDHPRNVDGAVALGATNLQGAVLQGANFTGANLFAADLTGANLVGANLTDANFMTYYENGQSYDFRSYLAPVGWLFFNPNLRYVILAGVDLGDADISLADLTGADLTGADLGGVVGIQPIFIDANLRDANINLSYLNAVLGNTTCPNGSVTSTGC